MWAINFLAILFMPEPPLYWEQVFPSSYIYSLPLFFFLRMKMRENFPATWKSMLREREWVKYAEKVNKRERMTRFCANIIFCFILCSRNYMYVNNKSILLPSNYTFTIKKRHFLLIWKPNINHINLKLSRGFFERVLPRN